MKYPLLIIKKNTPPVEVKPAPIEVKEEDLVPVNSFWMINNIQIQIRDQGELRFKAFYLSTAYNWQIVTDSDGIVCLLPTRKG